MFLPFVSTSVSLFVLLFSFRLWSLSQAFPFHEVSPDCIRHFRPPDPRVSISLLRPSIFSSSGCPFITLKPFRSLPPLLFIRAIPRATTEPLRRVRPLSHAIPGGPRTCSALHGHLHFLSFPFPLVPMNYCPPPQLGGCSYLYSVLLTAYLFFRFSTRSPVDYTPDVYEALIKPNLPFTSFFSQNLPLGPSFATPPCILPHYLPESYHRTRPGSTIVPFPCRSLHVAASSALLEPQDRCQPLFVGYQARGFLTRDPPLPCFFYSVLSLRPVWIESLSFPGESLCVVPKSAVVNVRMVVSAQVVRNPNVRIYLDFPPCNFLTPSILFLHLLFPPSD